MRLTIGTEKRSFQKITSKSTYSQETSFARLCHPDQRLRDDFGQWASHGSERKKSGSEEAETGISDIEFDEE